MALLSKDQILNADDLKTVDVEVPEWGGTVRLRMMTGTALDALQASMTDTKGKNPKVNLANFRARLIAACAIDENGALMFTEADAKRLGSKSAAALNRVSDAAVELNGMNAEDVEAAAENFSDAPSGDSTSG